MGTQTECIFRVGDVLDEKWVILGFIGKGGMGEVYRAHQLNLDRSVAIKIISPVFLEQPDGDVYEAETCLGRFLREVKVMAQVRHPNILQIFDSGTGRIRKGDEEVRIPYIVMEYIPGGTIRATMSPEGFHPEEERTKEWLLHYFLPFLEGVCALHEAGIVHRDLKPENVLLDGKIPKIADFGLARSCTSTPFTQSMDMKGTPPYMSPEQFLDLKRADERADVYSLGKMLYEAICGQMTSDEIPFKKASLPVKGSAFFEKLAAVIEGATEEDRNARISSVRALILELEEALKAVSKARVPARARSGQTSSGRKIRASTVFVVVLLSAFTGIAIGLLQGKVPALLSSSRGKLTGPPPTAGEIAPGTRPPSELSGTDEDVMRIIPAGTVALSRDFGENEGRQIQLNSFYLDEMQVTNLQFVNFLNSVLSHIKVENEVVRGDGHLWLLLGQVMPGYEPIVYRDGKFRMQNAAHASCPVLRVSAYGASAYARYYGKRLPTELEWLYVAQQGRRSPDGAAPGRPADSRNMHMGASKMQENATGGSDFLSSPGDHAMMPSPVITQVPNGLGIRGMDGKIGEWVRKELKGKGNPKDSGEVNMVAGGAMESADTGGFLPKFVARQQWEAFEGVGFRCAMGLPKTSKTGVSPGVS